jgi:hypothetical protein
MQFSTLSKRRKNDSKEGRRAESEIVGQPPGILYLPGMHGPIPQEAENQTVPKGFGFAGEG